MTTSTEQKVCVICGRPLHESRVGTNPNVPGNPGVLVCPIHSTAGQPK